MRSAPPDDDRQGVTERSGRSPAIPTAPGRVRHLTGSGFKRAATAEEGVGRAPHPSGGVSQGRGSSRQQRQRKGRGGRLGRARRPTGSGFKQAATAEEGAGRPTRAAASRGARVQAGSNDRGRHGPGGSAGGGAPPGRGSDRRQRRRQGRGGRRGAGRRRA